MVLTPSYWPCICSMSKPNCYCKISQNAVLVFILNHQCCFRFKLFMDYSPIFLTFSIGRKCPVELMIVIFLYVYLCVCLWVCTCVHMLEEASRSSPCCFSGVIHLAFWSGAHQIEWVDWSISSRDLPISGSPCCYKCDHHTWLFFM